MKEYYAVYRNSLVYVFMLRGIKRAQVLRSFEMHIKETDILYINAEIYGEPREATQTDFDNYRIQKPKSK